MMNANKVWSWNGRMSCYAVALWLILGLSGHGSSVHWTGGAGDGEWGTAGNWSSAVVPGSGSEVVIPDWAQGVSLSGSVSVRRLENHGQVRILATGTIASLIVEEALWNSGELLLDSESARQSRILMGAEATLLNDGRIEGLAGGGGNRVLAGRIINRADIVAAAGVELRISGSMARVDQQAGGWMSAAADGSVVLENNDLWISGGAIGEAVFIEGGSIRIADGLVPQTLVVRRSTELLQMDSAAVTLRVLASGSGVTLNAISDLDNYGIIELDAASGHFSRIIVLDPYRLRNYGTIRSAATVGGSRTLSGNLLNAGQITASGGSTLRILGSGNLLETSSGMIEASGGGEVIVEQMHLKLSGGVMGEGSIVQGGVLEIGAGLAEQTVRVHATTTLKRHDSPAVTVRVQPQGSAVTLNILEDMELHGHVYLGAISGHFSRIIIAADVALTNSGSIVADGVFGSRSLSGGTLLNRGLIFAECGHTLQLLGTDLLLIQQEGGEIRADGQIRISGGTVELQGGQLGSGVVMMAGTLRALPGLAAQRLFVSSAQVRAEQLESPQLTIQIGGFESGSTTLNLVDGLVNRSKLVLQSIGGHMSRILVDGDGTWINEGEIHVGLGAGGSRIIGSNLDNRGRIELGEGVTLNLGHSMASLANSGIIRLQAASLLQVSSPSVLTDASQLQLVVAADGFTSPLGRVNFQAPVQLDGEFALQYQGFVPNLNPPVTVVSAPAASGDFSRWRELRFGDSVMVQANWASGLLSLSVAENPLRPAVASILPAATVAHLQFVDIAFNQPIQSASFGVGVVTLQGPAGVIAPLAISRIHPTVFRITFPYSETEGEYTLTIAGGVENVQGWTMAEPYQQVFSVLKPSLPDLQVDSLHAPQQLTAGGPATLSWLLRNVGTEPFVGTGTDSIYLLPYSAGQALAGAAPILLAAIPRSETALLPGAAIVASATVQIPQAAPHGELRFRVDFKPSAGVEEKFLANNQALADESSALQPTLSLTPSRTQIRENAGANALTLELIRSAGGTEPLVVEMSADDARLQLPAQLLLQPEQTRVTIPVGVVADGLAGEPVSVQLQASGNGYLPATTTLTLIDTDRATLHFAELPPVVAEGEQVTGQIEVGSISPSERRVRLQSNPAGVIQHPFEIVVPAGSDAVEFSLRVILSAGLRPDTEVILSASGSGFDTANASLWVAGSALPQLLLTIHDSQLSADTSSHTHLTIERSGTTLEPLQLWIANPRPDLLSTPRSITFANGQTRLSVPVFLTGNQPVDSSATVALQVGYGAPAQPLLQSNDVQLTVIAWTQKRLVLRLSPDVALPADPTATMLTVVRQPVSSDALVVTISSDNTALLEHLQSVIIPAHHESVVIPLATLNPLAMRYPATVRIEAQADEYAPAATTLVITPLPLPDLVVHDLVIPQPLTGGDVVEIGYSVTNQGSVAVQSPFYCRLLLHPANDPAQTYLLAQHYIEGGVAPAATLNRTARVALPMQQGPWRLRIICDATDLVREMREDNNELSSAAFMLLPRYTATVATAADTYAAGSAVVISGQALDADGLQLQAVVDVEVVIRKGGLIRSQIFTTADDGHFSGAWDPMAGESGDYELLAGQPGLVDETVQDSFRILAAEPPIVDPPLTGVRLIAAVELLRGSIVRGGSQVVELQIANIGDTDSGTLEFAGVSVDWIRPLHTELAAVNAGSDALFSVRIAPPETTELAGFSGDILLRDQASGSLLRIPFDLLVVSDRTASVVFAVENEFSYFGAGNPGLSGAQIRLTDYWSGDEVATGTSDAAGNLAIESITAGYYNVDIAAPQHLPFRDVIFIAPGSNNRVPVFLNYEAVRYLWEVVPVPFEDRYTIRITTEFQAEVPLPVVTVEPAFVDLAELLETATEAQVLFTVTNHGLINAEAARIEFPALDGIGIELPGSLIGDIKPLTSIHVPVRFYRQTPAGMTTALSPMSGGGTVNCEAEARVMYSYRCGLRGMERSSAVVLFPGRCSERPRPGRNQSAPAASGNSGSNRGSSGLWIHTQWLGDSLAWIGSRIPVWGAGEAAPRSVQTRRVALAGNIGNCGEAIDIPLLDCAIALGIVPPVVGTAITAYNCLVADRLQDCPGLLPGGPGGPYLACLADLLKAFEVAPSGVGDAPRQLSMGQSGVPMRAFVPQTGDQLRTAIDRIQSYLQWVAYIFGTEDWINTTSGERLTQWMDLLSYATASGDPEPGRISAAEQTMLLTGELPEGVDEAMVTRFMERWNRTLDYRAMGIFSSAELPVGWNSDFIAAEILNVLAANLQAAIADSNADGFADPFAEFAFYLNLHLQQRKGAVCASIRLEITQQAVLTRTAFEASLSLANDANTALESVHVQLAVFDADGIPRDELFAIIPLQGDWTDPDAEQSIAVGAFGSGSWRLIPSQDAVSGSEPALYRIGGRIHYRLNSVDVSIPMDPVEIQVHPQPLLKLSYYHERDVYADDPFTEQVEPSLPFSLGVIVRNHGDGIADDFTLTSGQPEIIDNDKGLAVEFAIISLTVDGEPEPAGLTAQFGAISPGQSRAAIWWLESTLQGQFIDYQATAVHLDAFGDLRLSLIDEVSIYESLGVIAEQRPQFPARSGFLVSDRFPFSPRPTEVHWQDGDIDPVVFKSAAVITGIPTPANPRVSVQASATDGWFYLRIAEPSQGSLTLLRAVRDDGRVIEPCGNLRVTNRTFRGIGLGPVDEHLLHLVDYGGSGNYSLIYAADQFPDITAPVSSVAELPPLSYESFRVTWDGTDDRGIAAFDVYVAEDDASYSIWLLNTTTRQAIFTGQHGKTYSFYSIASDAAGNREPLPEEAQAQTYVGLTRSPPTLTVPPQFTVAEGELFHYTVAGQPQAAEFAPLTYSITDAPEAMVIHPASGKISWQTGELNGGQTYAFRIQAADNGIPALHSFADVELTVVEVNQPPIIPVMPRLSIHQRETFTYAIPATDPDIPANTLQFAFADHVPDGMQLDPDSGVLHWTPADAVEPGLYPVNLRVSDNGIPARSTERTLRILVLPYRVNLSVMPHSASLAWQEGDAPLTLAPLAAVESDEALNFVGGSWQLSWQGGFSAGDELGFSAALLAGYGMALDGNAIYCHGVLIGALASAGNGPAGLRILFNGPVSNTTLSELFRCVTYRNTVRYPSATPRTLLFHVSDQAGRTASTPLPLMVIPVNTPPRLVSKPHFATTRDLRLFIPLDALEIAIADDEDDGFVVSTPLAASDAGGRLMRRGAAWIYEPPAGYSGWDELPFVAVDVYGAQQQLRARVWVRAADDPAAVVVADTLAGEWVLLGLPDMLFNLAYAAADANWQATGAWLTGAHGMVRIGALPGGGSPSAWRIEPVFLPQLRLLDSPQMRIQVIGSSSVEYRLQGSANLDSWSTIQAPLVAPNGVIEVPAPAPGDFQYYRLEWFP